MKKYCNSCKIKKLIIEFYRRQIKKYPSAFCKRCLIRKSIKWNKKNREKYNAYHRRWWSKQKLNKN